MNDKTLLFAGFAVIILLLAVLFCFTYQEKYNKETLSLKELVMKANSVCQGLNLSLSYDGDGFSARAPLRNGEFLCQGMGVSKIVVIER